jgi:hypothetical protein
VLILQLGDLVDVLRFAPRLFLRCRARLAVHQHFQPLAFAEGFQDFMLGGIGAPLQPGDLIE